jgi:ankyrin repeat domain-containing protein 50
LSIIKGLLLIYLDLEQIDNTRNRVFYYIFCWGYTKVIIVLLDARTIFEAENNSRCIVLERAAANKYKGIVRLLFIKDTNINKQTRNTRNTLYGIIAKGTRTRIQLLLDNKAEVNAQNKEYSNAFQTAVYRGNQVIVQLLLDNKAEINTQGGYFGNALQAAVSRDYQVII